MARAQASSAEPPPYTILSSLTRFLATQRASWRERIASSTTILLPPLTKMVTALDEHTVTSGPKPYFTDHLGKSKLLRGQLLESGDDPCTRSKSEELYFNSTHPADSWQIVMHQQVIGLVIKAPLAYPQSSPTVFALLHHIKEIILLSLPEHKSLALNRDQGRGLEVDV
jgi:hypothetical protein